MTDDTDQKTVLEALDDLRDMAETRIVTRDTNREEEAEYQRANENAEVIRAYVRRMEAELADAQSVKTGLTKIMDEANCAPAAFIDTRLRMIIVERDELREKIDNAHMAASETARSPGTRFLRIMGALGFNYGDADDVDKSFAKEYADLAKDISVPAEGVTNMSTLGVDHWHDDEWEYTHRADDTDQLESKFEHIGYDEIIEVHTLIKGPTLYAAYATLSRTEDGDIDDTELRIFGKLYQAAAARDAG